MASIVDRSLWQQNFRCVGSSGQPQCTMMLGLVRPAQVHHDGVLGLICFMSVGAIKASGRSPGVKYPSHEALRAMLNSAFSARLTWEVHQTVAIFGLID